MRELKGLLVLVVGWLVPVTVSSFHSLPLVPHHVQQRRRRLEEGVNTINGTTTSSSSVDTEWERRQSRWSNFNFDSNNQNDNRQLRAQQVGALYQGYGTHYIDLWCGTPTPQRQTVIVDTGSAVTAFPCSGCRELCGKDYHIDQVFDETLSETFEILACDECMRGRCTVKSSSAKDNNCKIGMSYQEGSSWSAFEGRDTCYVGGPHGRPLTANSDSSTPDKDVDATGESTADVDPELASSHAFPLVYGCQTKLTGLFKTQLADGIMGMDNAREAFWKQMSAAGKMDEDIFTLCFARQPTADREGTEAGAMTLGGIDTRLHTSPIVYAAVGVSNAFYGVHLRNVYLREGGGGDSATSSNPDLKVKRIDISETDLNRGTTIVDSGTTDTYFTRNIASAFQSLWKEMTGKTYNNNPISLSEEELNNMPTIIFQLQGLTDVNEKLSKEAEGPVVGLAGDLDPENPYDILLAMPPSHYMEYDTDIKKYVPRFYTDEGRGSVLGANVMMGHNMIFDQVNGRLGVAESHCDYVDLVTKMGFDWNGKEPYNKADHMDTNDNKEDKEKAEETIEKEQEKEGEDGDDEEDDKRKEAVHAAVNDSGEGFCSSSTCRGSIVVVTLAAVVGFVLLRKGKSSSTGIPVPYSTELELQAPPENDSGEFGHYRDDDEDHDDFHDEEIE